MCVRGVSKENPYTTNQKWKPPRCTIFSHCSVELSYQSWLYTASGQSLVPTPLLTVQILFLKNYLSLNWFQIKFWSHKIHIREKFKICQDDFFENPFVNSYDFWCCCYIASLKMCGECWRAKRGAHMLIARQPFILKAAPIEDKRITVKMKNNFLWRFTTTLAHLPYPELYVLAIRH